jgi:hypothetical protein
VAPYKEKGPICQFELAAGKEPDIRETKGVKGADSSMQDDMITLNAFK